MKQKRRLRVVLLTLSLIVASGSRAAAPASAQENVLFLDCSGSAAATRARVFVSTDGKTAQMKVLAEEFPVNNEAWVDITNLQFSDKEILGNVRINSAIDPKFRINRTTRRLVISTPPAYEIENIFNFEGLCFLGKPDRMQEF